MVGKNLDRWALLGAGTWTPEQANAAALVVCERTGSPEAAAPVLEMLGLIGAPTGPTRRWDSVGVVHGTRSAVEWHDEQTNQQHRTLCGPCQQYADVTGRLAAFKARHAEGGD